MRKITLLLLPAVTVTIAFMFCNEPVKSGVAGQSISQDSLVKRGRYMVSTMGCNDCHSPKLYGPQGPYPDPDRLLSGHPAEVPIEKYDTVTTKNWVLFNQHFTAVVGPWGISFAANLTSDSTGIGAWTEEQFFKAIREGKSKGLDGARPILPPMPWQELAHLTDDDIKAMFAYLKSTKPVKNVVPPPVMAGK